jgi:hypothetical protein
VEIAILMKNSILENCLRQSLKLNQNHPEKNNGYHHFSFLIQNNQILGYGYNRTEKCKPLYGYKKYQSLHSENTVYFKCKGLLQQRKSFELVNIRLSKKNILKISKPCNCCLKFLNGLGCNNVWFTTGSDLLKWGKIKL